MKDVIEAFKAVGESTRFRALRAMIDAGADLCACEIIDVLQKPQYTISKSLGILVSAGLIDERRDGRMMMYSLVHTPANDAIFAAVGDAPLDGESLGDGDRLKGRLARRSAGLCVTECL
jgi:ArsR family transcriptional regulator